jgi:predicted amidohydrolase YtcJ
MSRQKFELLLFGVTCTLIGLSLAEAPNSIGGVSIPRQSSQSASQRDGSGFPVGPADLVLKNGVIFTGTNDLPPWAHAVVIKGDRIIWVVHSDADADIHRLIGPKTRVIDLHGQFAMPGFNDAHAHLAAGAYVKLEVDLRGTKSVEEFQQRIRARLKEFGPGEWIIAPGWDHTLWPVKKFPSRQDLDAISTDHPIFCQRVDGHVAVVNSQALKIAGITRETPDPPGGHIERDPSTGEPTGMLEEDAAMNLVYDRVPPFS